MSDCLTDAAGALTPPIPLQDFGSDRKALNPEVFAQTVLEVLRSHVCWPRAAPAVPGRWAAELQSAQLRRIHPPTGS